MRLLLVILIVSTSLFAQNAKGHQSTANINCAQDAGLLYEEVLNAIWNGDNNPDYSKPSGLISIVVSPNWDPQYFFSVLVNEGHPSKITIYSLPKGKKYIQNMIEDALRRAPCSGAREVAAKLPVKKRIILADKRVESVIQEFFSLKVVPQLSRSIRLDATVYDVRFDGDETLRFHTDNFRSPLAKWVDDFEDAVYEQSKESSWR